MTKIRVLIVDDAVVVRRLVSDILGDDPEIEVVGTAANGRIALAKIAQVNPDLITLDVEMPEMDGLQALAAIRKSHPRLPVIMFSTLTQRGGSATLEALALGANDYVTKPANVGSVQEAKQRIRQELIPKIKQFCGRAQPVIPTVRPLPVSAGLPTRSRVTMQQSSRVDIVAIGVSTGGPNALAELLPALPGTLGVPIVIVQHMPPMFTRLLAERLAARSALEVAEACKDDLLTPGKVLIAPGDYHMCLESTLRGMGVKLHQEAPENSCRPAVDVLFRSVAERYRSGVLGIVLTGMGQDGLRGCESIKDRGGQVLAQDEASSVVWGMPGFVARAGLADKVLPLDQMATEITRRVNKGRTS